MIEIYTDGACSGNPGPGGWAAILVFGESNKKQRVHGGEDKTTNNRMELLAVINGLEATPASVEIKVFSDSTYVVNTVNRNWKRNANRDLWRKLDNAMSNRTVTFEWTKGHAGHPLNEEADKLARNESTSRTSNISMTKLSHPKSKTDKIDHQLSHVNELGQAHMVDVGDKPQSRRIAIAKGSVCMKAATLELISGQNVAKGDVLATARVAGIMAAKATYQFIPLCHQLQLDQVSVDFDIDNDKKALSITAAASTYGKTGVEMEALTAVTVTALTIYDMCKSSDREMSIDNVRLVRKSGGMSGHLELES